MNSTPCLIDALAEKTSVQCYRNPKAMLLLQQSYCCRLVSRQPAHSFSCVPEQQLLPSSWVTEHQIAGVSRVVCGDRVDPVQGLFRLIQLCGEASTLHTDMKIYTTHTFVVHTYLWVLLL